MLTAFCTWTNLCDLVYQPPTKTYQSVTAVAFSIPVTWLPCLHTEHLPATQTIYIVANITCYEAMCLVRGCTAAHTLTTVWIMLMRSLRIWLVIAKTSTTPSASAWSSRQSSAMNAPVRPTPALTTGDKIIIIIVVILNTLTYHHRFINSEEMNARSVLQLNHQLMEESITYIYIYLVRILLAMSTMPNRQTCLIC